MMHLSIVLLNLFSMTIIFLLFSRSNEARAFRKLSVDLSSYKPRIKLSSKLETRYLQQTQLSRHMGMNTLLGLYLIWVTVALVLTILSQTNILMSFLILVVSSGLPLLLLEKYLSWLDLKIDQGIFELLTQINARLVKNEDILVAIKDAQASLKNKYVLFIVERFNQMIKVGIPPAQVFKSIQASVHNDYMKYVLINIEVVLSRRGNIPALMKALESEFTSIQIEVNKRKVELEYEKNMMVFSIMLVALTVIKIVDDHDYILTYFQRNQPMIYLVVVFIVFGVFFAFSTSRSSY